MASPKPKRRGGSKAHLWCVNLLLLANGCLLAYGLTMPLITFQQLIFFKKTFSVLSGIKALYLQQQYLLFVLVLVFSVVIPIVKLLILLINWNFPPGARHVRRKILSLSAVLARWSMLDVFAVAIFVVMMKIDFIAQVQTHRGLVVFTGAVLGLMLLTGYINFYLSRRLSS